MGIFFFCLTVLIIPGLPSAAVVPRWALLSVAIPLIMLWRNVDAPRGVLAVFVCLAVMAFVSPDPYEALRSLWIFAVLLAAYCVGRSTGDLRGVFVGVALGMWVNSAAVVAQYFGWVGVPQITSHAGLFLNRNAAVEACAMVLVYLVYKRMWWLVPGLLPTLMAGARAPILAIGVATFISAFRYSRFWAMMGLLLSTLAVVVLSSYNVAAWSSIVERYNLWRDVVPSLTVFGHGLGSFEYLFPLYQDSTNALQVRFDHPHNELLHIAFELGVFGVIGACMWIWDCLQREASAEWYALVVFLVEAMFQFPLYMPLTGVLFALCAGVVSRSRPRVRSMFASVRLGIP